MGNKGGGEGEKFSFGLKTVKGGCIVCLFGCMNVAFKQYQCSKDKKAKCMPVNLNAILSNRCE